MTTTELDLQDWRESVRGFMTEKWPEARLRSVLETPEGFDRELWCELGQQLGLAGLLIPERFGGSEVGLVEVGIAFEELGRALYCGPALSAILASRLLLCAGDQDAQEDLLPLIASGAQIASVALIEGSGSWDPASVRARASERPAGWRISGTKRFVPDANTADLLLVAAQADRELGLFAVDARASGVRIETHATMDQTRRLSDVILDDASARRIEVKHPTDLFSDIQSVGAAVVASEQSGGAAAAFDLAVDYAKDRVQYGRPIGSFQAIKHRCADMLVAIEATRSAVRTALSALDRGSTDAAMLASMAKVIASETYRDVTGASIQIHGGIGVTWEHPIHYFFKRAKASSQLFGPAGDHRRELATALDIGGRI